MLDVAARGRIGTEEAVRDLIVARVHNAQRLATWILHDPAAAEDAVQEAALLAWDRRASLRDAANVEAWFNRILVNVCRTELRRRAKPPVLIELQPGEGHADAVARRDELTEAIRSLVPEEQLLLALRFGRDLTVPQIAAATGSPEGTVKSRLHYALDHLRAALDAGRRVEEVQR